MAYSGITKEKTPIMPYRCNPGIHMLRKLRNNRTRHLLWRYANIRRSIMPNPNLPINGQYNTYVGARYVPKFANPVEWDNTKQYEPLTIVTNQGNSYTSTTFVPIGTAITNTMYWAPTGNYNAQVEQYRQEVLAYNNRISLLETINAKNILELGAKNDGTMDISEILNTYSPQFDIYLPEGTYLVNETVNLKHGLIGPSIGNVRTGARIISNVPSGDLFTCNTTSLVIQNLSITASGAETAILHFTHTSYANCAIFGVNIRNVGNGKAISLEPALSISRYMTLMFCTLEGNMQTSQQQVGIYVNGNAPDCSFIGLTVMGFVGGLEIQSGHNRFVDVHIWGGVEPVNQPMSVTRWNNTYGIKTNGVSSDEFTSLYLDTCAIGMITANNNLNITDFIYINEPFPTGGNKPSLLYSTTNTGKTVKIVNGYIDARNMNNLNYDGLECKNVTIYTDNLNDNAPLLLSFPDCFYSYDTSSTVWNCIAVAKNTYLGATSFLVNVGNNMAIIAINSTTVTKITLCGNVGAYYSTQTTGSTTLFYIYVKGIDTRITVKGLSGTASLSLINLQALNNWNTKQPFTLPTQATNEGLTVITEKTYN